MKVVLLCLYIIAFLAVPLEIKARVTPEDIVNAQKEAYQVRVRSYSPEHQQKLEDLSRKIALVNKRRTDELEYIMVNQGAILDEYERRPGVKNIEVIEKARYWITYAHEAVAYQAAKIYIFNLSSEGNIRADANSAVNLFQSDLNSAGSKVINSQNILKGVVNK